jgi:hypothetical protein
VQPASLARRLRDEGPTAADDVRGITASSPLDMDDPEKRSLAVRATIAASTSRLTGDDPARLAKLGVFAEDETIPFALAALRREVTGWAEPAGQRPGG